MSPELKGYMDGAGAEVADTVAARMAELANAVFPMSPMERQPTKLAMLGDRGVSLRGAEVSNATARPASAFAASMFCGKLGTHGCFAVPFIYMAVHACQPTCGACMQGSMYMSKPCYLCLITTWLHCLHWWQ